MKIARVCERDSRRGHRSMTRCGMTLSPHLRVRIHLMTHWRRLRVDQDPREILLLRALTMSLRSIGHPADGPRAWEVIWEDMEIEIYTPRG